MPTFDAPVLSGYGLTEAPILTMAALTDPDDELADTEGKPMPGVELRVVTLTTAARRRPARRASSGRRRRR